MSFVSIMAASSTMRTVRLFHAVRPFLTAKSSLWMVAARVKPSRPMSCATALVGARPMTL